jgi:conjugative relaxase-like TrwC/TraI family protein
VTTNTTLHAGHDVRYLTSGKAHGGNAGAMRYYTASGEPPGRWAGKGAAALGLSGTVDGKIMDRLYMQHVGPSGERLTRPRGKAKDDDQAEAAFRAAHPFASETEVAEAVATARAGTRTSVPYYDLTVSAAKSISVLHASLKIAALEAYYRGDLVAAGKLNAEADGIEADLEAAARFALQCAEAEACYTRTGHHSATTGEWRDGAGLIAAMFTHHISRDGDPQLHVHIAIANLVQRADGGDEKYRRLDTRALHNQRLSIAAQVDREMEARLTARGYAMVPRADGNGCEIGGVSQQVMGLFSSRTAGLTPELEKMVTAYERKYGHPPSRRTLWLMDQQAAAMTRRSKSQARKIHGRGGGDAGEAERLAAWEAQTAAREMTALSQVHRGVAAFGSRPVAVIDGNLEAMAARAAVAEVQAHHAVWSLSELRFEVGRALPPGATPELVRKVADLAVTPGSGTGVLLVTAPEVTDVTALGTRRDGTSIYRPPNQARYTTSGQVDLEERILRQARKQVPQRVSQGMARRALDGSGLTEEQQGAAVRLLTSQTMVSVLTAAAGAGKTHTVAAFASAWTRLTGRRVIGITTAENAARQMTAEGLAEVYNSAAFLGKTPGSELLRYPVQLNAGDVLVLDEASMISTADLALLMDCADRAGALVMPTGDACQLGPVEAGGMFPALIAELGATELSEVMRFDAHWERDASARLRAGDFSAVAAYDRRGRIRGDHREAAYDRAAGAWLADHLHGKDTILLAGSTEEAAELARRVQARLVKMGTVVHPRAPLADGNRAGTGDLIRARLNARIDAGGQKLTNRDVLLIEGWQGQDAEVTRQLPGGGWSARFLVPRDYLAADAELHYAGNIHVAQGRTVDTAHVLVTDTLSRQSFYVAMSRGRQSNIAHVVTGETAPEGAEPYQQTAPEAVIHQVMERDSAELSAIEQIRASQEWASGTGHVLNLWAAAIRETFTPAVDRELRQALSGSDYARYSREHQRPALLDSLRGRMLAGQDITAAIREITRAPMDGARSVAAVLHHRLAELAKPDAPLSWAARTPEGAGEIAQATAEALDARAAALGDRLLAEPEPWVMRHLGPPPCEAKPGLQAMLETDYSRRAGIAQSYREAAGITDPHQVIRWDGHKGNPELEALRQDAIRALQIRDEQADLAGLDRGQLEAKAIAGARARAAAPRDVSAELRAAAQLETDLRVQGGEALTQGENAAVYNLAADELAADQAELEAANTDYEAWSDSTAQTREIAEKAQRELERRGYRVPDWTPEDESSERQADEPEGQADTPEVEADEPEVETGQPLVPEPEANAPEVADRTGPEPEPEPDMV